MFIADLGWPLAPDNVLGTSAALKLAQARNRRSLTMALVTLMTLAAIRMASMDVGNTRHLNQSHYILPPCSTKHILYYHHIDYCVYHAIKSVRLAHFSIILNRK